MSKEKGFDKNNFLANINKKVNKKNEESECNKTLHENLIEIKNKKIIEYTADPEINNFLADNTLLIKVLHANASIKLGKIFTDVKEKLGRKKELEGFYIIWLEDNGFNRMTALRHRNRYELFTLCKTEVGQITIATVTMKIINGIMKLTEKEKLEYIKRVDNGLDIEDLENEIISLNVKPEKQERDLTTKIEIYDFLNEEKLNDIKNENEYKFYNSKLSEFEEIVKDGRNKLLDVKLRIDNDKNKFKKVVDID